MATIVTVNQYDVWEGVEPLKTLITFIEQDLMTFPGSSGFGGIESSNPLQSAKNWANEKGFNSAQHGYLIEITDTQSPPSSYCHKIQLYPELNDYNYAESWT